MARYNEPADDNDFARAIAVDNKGNVYVTGSSKKADFSFSRAPDCFDYDYVTIKHSGQ